MKKTGSKSFLKLFLMLSIATILCLPVKVFAAENGEIGSLLAKVKNVYGNSLSRASNYKSAKTSELQKRLNSYQMAASTKYTGIASSFSGIKNSIPGITSSLPKISGSFSGIKNSIPGITSSLPKISGSLSGIKGNLSSIKNVFKGPDRPSQLKVVWGKEKDAEMMINNLSSRQFVVNHQGYVLPASGATENLSKSREYSIIIENLINGTKPTNIIVNKNSLPYGMQQEGKSSHIVTLGTKSAIAENGDLHCGDFTLAHELIHSFREEKNLTTRPYVGLGAADEEACTILVENLIRHKNGYPIRTDGAREDDVNKDGKPDGDNSYGKYLFPTIGSNWDKVYFNSTSK